MRALLLRTLALASALLAPRATDAACADTVLARAVKRYAITGSSPQTYTESCTLAVVAGRRYLVEVLRPTGGPSGTFARVVYQGVELLGTDDLGTAGVLVSRAFTPDTTATLLVALSGASGFGVDLRITHVPEPLHQVFTRTFVRGSGAPKWQSQVFGFMSGTPPGPHRMVIVNGNPDSTLRTQDTEIELNGNQIVFTGEITQGRAILTYDVTLESENTVRAKIHSPSGRRVSLYFMATDTSGPSIVFSAPPETTVTRDASLAIGGTVDEPETGERITLDGTPLPMSAGSFSTTAALTTDGWRRITFVATNGGCQSDTAVRVAIRDTLAPSITLTSPSAATTTVSAATDSFTIAGAWRDSTWTTIRVDGDTVATGWALHAPVAFSRKVPLDYGPNGILVMGHDAAGNIAREKRYVFRMPPGDGGEDSTAFATDVPALPATEASAFRSEIRFLMLGQSSIDTTALLSAREAVIRGRVRSRDFGALGGVRVSALGQGTLGYTETRNDGWFDLVVNGAGPVVLRFTRLEFLEVQRQVEVPANDFVTLGGDVTMIGRSTKLHAVNTSGTPAPIRGRFEGDANGEREMTMLFAPATVCSVTTTTGTSTYTSFSVRLKEFTVGAEGDESMPGSLPPSSAYTYCVDMTVAEAESGSPSDPPADVRFSKPVVTYVREFLGLTVGSRMPSGWYDQRRGVWVGSEDGWIVKVLGASGGLALLDTDGDGNHDAQSRFDSLGIDSLERVRVASLYATGDKLWRVRVDHFSPRDYNLNVAALTQASSPAAARAGQLGQLFDVPSASCGCIIENENRVLGETIPIQGTPYALHYRSNRQSGDKAMRSIRIPLTTTPTPGIQAVRVEVEVAGRVFRERYASVTSNMMHTFDDWDGTDVYGRPVRRSLEATVRVGYEFEATYSAPSDGAGDAFGDGSRIPTTGAWLAPQDRAVSRILWSTQRVALGAPSMAAAGLGGWTISPHHIYDPIGRGALYRGDGGFQYGNRQYPIINRYAGSGRYYGSGTGYGNYPIDGAPAIDGNTNIAPLDLAVSPTGDLLFTDELLHVVSRITPSGLYYRVVGKSDATAGDFSGDGTMANTCPLSAPKGLAYASDGSFYFVDSGHDAAYRVKPDGTIWRIAGQPGASWVEDTLAVHAPLEDPSAIAVSADGTIFIADRFPGTSEHARVLRLATNGTIRTFAGSATGSIPTEGNTSNGRADSLALRQPIGDMVVDREGNLIFTERQSVSRVRRVTPDGRLGTLSFGATPTVHGLAIGPDQQPYVTIGLGFPSVSRLEALGGVTVVAGGNATASSWTANDGEFASAARFHNQGPRAIAFGLRGEMYFALGAGPNPAFPSGIYRIAGELPSQSIDEIAYPASDGQQLHFFTTGGRHLRTQDATTGVVTHRFEYDGAGRLVRLIDADGDTTRVTRDASGFPLTIVAPRGQVTTISVADSGRVLQQVTSPGSRVHSMTYESGGLLSTFTNPRSRTWDYTWDPVQGRLAEDEDPAGGGQTFALDQGDTTRLVTKVTAGGRTTNYRLIETRSGFRRHMVFGPGSVTSTWVDSVDAAPNTTALPGATLGPVQVSFGPTGDRTIVFQRRDPQFSWFSPIDSTRVITLTLPGGPAAFVGSTRLHSGSTRQESYAINGRRWLSMYDTTTMRHYARTPTGRLTTTQLDAAGRPTSITTGTLAPTTITYDTHGRPTVVAQGGRGLRLAYDALGRTTHVRDTLGRMTTFAHDAADRVTSQVLPGGRTVAFGYDANGNLTSLTPPGRSAHTFAHTPIDLTESYTPPAVPGVSDPATGYTYDLDGLLTGLERADGGEVTLGYQSGTTRLATLTQPRGVHAFTYQSGTDLVASVSSPDTVSLAYTYTGPLLKRETWSGKVSGYVERTHDSDFHVWRETVNGAWPAYFEHDADGLLTRAGALALTRRASDGLVSATSVGVVTSTMSYDSHGELWRLRYEVSGGLLFQQTLVRDSLGRIVRVEETGLAPRTIDYRHDAAGRLDRVTVDGVRQDSVGYDANGNRTAWQGVAVTDTATATTDAQDRLVRHGAATYTHTADGERTMRIVGTDTTRYAYDALGSLVQVVLPGADTVRYRHDGLGRRVERRQAGTATRRWLYGDAIAPVVELDETDAVVARYVHGTWGHAPDLMLTPTAGYRVVSDHLGSVRMLVDTLTGALVRHVQRTAWGVATLDTGSVATSLGYAGGLTDPATGLVRFGARDHEPETGRWTTKDPIGLAGGTNVYAYAANRPERLVDPEGAVPHSPEATQSLGAAMDELLAATPTIPQPVVDAIAGFGDGASFGVSAMVRSLTPGNEAVDYCTPQYEAGFLTGWLTSMLMARRGPELRIGKNFRLAPWGNRTGHKYGALPHYHRRYPGSGGGIGRHRPYEGF